MKNLFSVVHWKEAGWKGVLKEQFKARDGFYRDAFSGLYISFLVVSASFEIFSGNFRIAFWMIATGVFYTMLFLTFRLVNSYREIVKIYRGGTEDAFKLCNTTMDALKESEAERNRLFEENIELKSRIEALE